MKTFYPGATVYLPFYIYDINGALVDPAAISISIYDPNSVAVLTNSAATQISTGYYYNTSYTVPATDTLTGIYTWLPKTTDGAIVIRDTAFQFEVRIETGD